MCPRYQPLSTFIVLLFFVKESYSFGGGVTTYIFISFHSPPFMISVTQGVGTNGEREGRTGNRLRESRYGTVALTGRQHEMEWRWCIRFPRRLGTHHTTRHHIPQDNYLHSHRREDLRYILQVTKTISQGVCQLGLPTAMPGARDLRHTPLIRDYLYCLP